MTCRCACKAYGGACDCRFDGQTQGRQRGEDETVAAIAAWLRARLVGLPPSTHEEAIEDQLRKDILEAVENGDWRSP